MLNNFFQNQKAQLAAAFGVSAALIAVSAIVGSSDKPNYAVNMSLSHTRNTGSFADLTANKFKELLEQHSNKSMSLTIYPNSGVAGGDSLRSIEMITDGSLDIQVCSPAQLSQIDPRFEAFWLPFLFDNQEQFEHFLNDPEVISTISSWLDEKGLVFLGMSNSGARQFFNDSHEITSPDDFKNLNIRVENSNVLKETYEALGANVIAKSQVEVPRAARAGEIDGQANTISSFLSTKLYEQHKFVTLWDGVWDANIWVVNKKEFEKLTDQQKEVFTKSAQEAIAWRNNLFNEFGKLYEKTLTDKGVTITKLTEEQKDLFRQAVLPVYEKYVNLIGKDTVMFFVNHRGVDEIVVPEEPQTEVKADPINVTGAGLDLANKVANGQAAQEAAAQEATTQEATAQEATAQEATTQEAEEAPEIVEIIPTDELAVKEGQIPSDAVTETAPEETVTTQTAPEAATEATEVVPSEAAAQTAPEATEEAVVEEEVAPEIVEIVPTDDAQLPQIKAELDAYYNAKPQVEASAPSTEAAPSETEVAQAAPTVEPAVQEQTVAVEQQLIDPAATVVPAAPVQEQTATVEQQPIDPAATVAPAAPVQEQTATVAQAAVKPTPATAEPNSNNVVADQANVPGFKPIVPSIPSVSGFDPVVQDVPAVSGFNTVVDSYPRHVNQALQPYAVRPVAGPTLPGQPTGFGAAQIQCAPINSGVIAGNANVYPQANYIQQVTYQLIEVAPNQFQFVPVVQLVPQPAQALQQPVNLAPAPQATQAPAAKPVVAPAPAPKPAVAPAPAPKPAVAPAPAPKPVVAPAPAKVVPAETVAEVVKG